MMLYKQGRFWVEGASFQIPEGFYIETDPDVNYERGLAAWDPTRAHLYLWAISEEEEEGTFCFSLADLQNRSGKIW